MLSKVWGPWIHHKKTGKDIFADSLSIRTILSARSRVVKESKMIRVCYYRGCGSVHGEESLYQIKR